MTDYSEMPWKEFSSTEREAIYEQWSRGLIPLAQMPLGSLHVDPTGTKYMLGHRVTNTMASMLPETSLVLIASSPSMELENLSEEEKNAFVVETLDQARTKLIASSPKSIELLERIRDDDGEPAAIRVKAATEILDRAGIKSGEKIQLEVEHKINPSEIIMAKLEEIAKRALGTQQQLEEIHIIDENGMEIRN